MQKAKPLQVKWWSVAFFLPALVVVVADQLSKAWIRANLELGQSLPLLGFLRLTRINNTGAAFGLIQDKSTLLTIVTLVGVVALLLYGLFLHRLFPLKNMLGRLALGLVLGGAAGNLIDRFRFGRVTDFIEVSIWPLFNVADSAITIGIIVCAYLILRSVQAEKS